MDLWTIGGLALAGLALYALLRLVRRRMRYRALLSRYGSEKIAADIMARKIWTGMTEEQLADSWGPPADIDSKVLKTKTTAVWKWGPLGGNRYKERVKLDDGIVTGWELK